jgi:Na+/alanine symporter
LWNKRSIPWHIIYCQINIYTATSSYMIKPWDPHLATHITHFQSFCLSFSLIIASGNLLQIKLQHKKWCNIDTWRRLCIKCVFTTIFLSKIEIVLLSKIFHVIYTATSSYMIKPWDPHLATHITHFQSFCLSFSLIIASGNFSFSRKSFHNYNLIC